MDMNLTLAQLRAVLAVARTRSFTRASEELLVAQSSLSRTVAQVERLAGVALFERTTRQVALTTDGQVFANMAEQVVRAYDQGSAHFAGYLRGNSGVLRLAALPSLAATLIPQVVVRLRALHPAMHVEVEDVLAADIDDSVRDGLVDFAVTASLKLDVPGPAAPDDLRFESMATDVFRLVTAPGHPLARRDAVPWRSLAHESFVSFDDASSVRSITDAVLANQGIVPVSQVTARNVATVAGLCGAGLGVSAAPSFVLPLMKFAELALTPLTEPVVRRQVGILSDPRRVPGRAATSLLQVLRNMALEGAPLPDGASWTK
jgi:DNA-binding transcriptional LysR family regulator